MAVNRPSELLPSIALIRGIAALAVVYDHLVGSWLQVNGVTWRPALLADAWLFDPLHLMMHGGGVAVAMFFLVSGFVIVMVSQRETLVEFVMKRALRIFPPLWASLALLIVVYAVALKFSDNAVVRSLALDPVLNGPNVLRDVVAAATLVNYWIGTPPVNGVAWTLAIEVLFYTAVALLLPLIKRRPLAGLCIAFAALSLLQWDPVAHSNAVVFLVAVCSVYATYLFLGSVIYLRWAGRIGSGAFVIATIAFAGLFLHGVRSIVLQPPYDFSHYGVSYAMAWIAFVILILLDPKLRLGRITGFFSRISYSLYLNHGGLGLLLLTVLYPLTGYAPALALTFVLVVAVSAASYRWIERPSQQLARRWLRRRAPVALPAPEPS